MHDTLPPCALERVPNPPQPQIRPNISTTNEKPCDSESEPCHHEMFPRSQSSWPRPHRRRSAESLRSLHSNASSASESSCDDCISHCDDFLDDHLPFDYFQQDVIRLIHRLRIPGWSLVSLDMAPDLELSRISGALTNSVYAVKAPSYVKDAVKREYAGRPYHHRLPPSLLLRVYGPQVGLLIDREKELETVESLTKLNIGPRLMGTFKNGRFEQFLNAKPLTRMDLRIPETSMMIARRMRNLHDNVPLSAEDVRGGSRAWNNIEKWHNSAAQQLAQLERRVPGTTQRVIGRASFDELLTAIRAYHAYLQRKYADTPLVFCHNDTQYGNILRLDPPKGSPLLQPQNEHRQLVVIDFEYSGANPRAYDIANHFCEWMGDYHHETMPHHVWTERYPTLEEQQRFIGSYVEAGSLDFNEEAMAAESASLLDQVRDWRATVSTHWALWGIVQTPVKDDFALREEYLQQNPNYEVVTQTPEEDTNLEQDDSFDYLSYSSDKIALFWNDLAELGILDA